MITCLCISASFDVCQWDLLDDSHAFHFTLRINTIYAISAEPLFGGNSLLVIEFFKILFSEIHPFRDNQSWIPMNKVLWVVFQLIETP